MPRLDALAPGDGADSGLEHHRSLDGLRGLAVAAVVAYHGGFAWMQGGYLGVSAFFTLSGFLITRLLLAEQRCAGRIDLRRFWVRRARRLLPAALMALAGIVAFGATVATPEQLADLRADVLAALGYGANWRFIASGSSYADLSGAPSPLQHFWSLAIEEQFYLVFPLAMVGLLRAGRGRLAPVFGVLAALTVASVAASAWLAPAVPGGNTDRIYYGTDTRAAELLVGALAAVVLAGDGRRRRHACTPRPSRALLNGTALAALAMLALAWSALPATSPALYRGGLALHALAIAVVIHAALRPGPVRTLLAAAPIRGLGRISYGVYLYHWPILMWLTPERTELGTGPLFALRTVTTLSAAALSYALIEQPIKEGRLRLVRPMAGSTRRPDAPAGAVRPAGVLMAAVVVVAVVLGATAVTARRPPPAIDFDAARSSLAADSGAVSAPWPASGPGPLDAVPVVAAFGDSTAVMASRALQRWSSASAALRVVDGSTLLGCGLPGGGRRRHGDTVEAPTDDCETRTRGWPALAEQRSIDIAVVQVGPWEIIDHELPGDDRWRAPGDPVFDRWLRTEITAAAALLDASGLRVVWLTLPPFGSSSWLDRDGVDDVDVRVARFNEIVLGVAREQPGMRVVDLGAYVTEQPGGVEDGELRPDGVHFSEDSAATVGRWLGPAVLEAARSPAGTVVGP